MPSAASVYYHDYCADDVGTDDNNVCRALYEHRDCLCRLYQGLRIAADGYSDLRRMLPGVRTYSHIHTAAVPHANRHRNSCAYGIR